MVSKRGALPSAMRSCCCAWAAADRAAGRRIACPVLLVWGRGYLTGKASSPLAIWRRWADKVEEIALDCGHFVAEEEPDACAQALGAFFAAARF